MAVAYVDSSLGQQDESGNLVVAGANLVLLAALFEDSISPLPAPSAIVFNGSEALSAITGAETSGVTADAIKVWQLIAPSATTAEVTTTGGFNAWGCIAAAFSGAHQTTPVPTADLVVLESAAATSRSAPVPNMTANDLAFAFIAINGSSAGFTPDGTTHETQASGGWSYLLVTKSGTGTVSIGASGWSIARCSIVAGRVAAAAAGGSIVNRESVRRGIGRGIMRGV